MEVTYRCDGVEGWKQEKFRWKPNNRKKYGERMGRD